MRAVFANGINPDSPLAVLKAADITPPSPPNDWVKIAVRASALNHHDLWSLRGVGLSAEQCPMILGCDAAGIDDQGAEVLVHAVIGDPSAAGAGEDETLDPQRTLLSERYPGTLAEYVFVPRRNVVPKPPELSFIEAACLPTAWLTAYRMLITRGRLPNSGSVLIQGAGGGVATAAAVIARACDARVYVTSRDIGKRARIRALGAVPLEPGMRLPERVDVVIETVGAPTLEHSCKCAKPGGRIVIAGATGGPSAPVNLRRIFFSQLELVGSTMGTRQELVQLVDFCVKTGIRPVIDSVYPFSQAPVAFARLASGEAFGKIVLDHTITHRRHRQNVPAK